MSGDRRGARPTTRATSLRAGRAGVATRVARRSSSGSEPCPQRATEAEKAICSKISEPDATGSYSLLNHDRLATESSTNWVKEETAALGGAKPAGQPLVMDQFREPNIVPDEAVEAPLTMEDT